MYWSMRYALALLPAAITLGGWQLAIWSFGYFGCHGDIKHLATCHAGAFNLLPWLGLGLFWCPLLSFLTVPVSAWLLIYVGATHIGSHNGGEK